MRSLASILYICLIVHILHLNYIEGLISSDVLLSRILPIAIICLALCLAFVFKKNQKLTAYLCVACIPLVIVGVYIYLAGNVLYFYYLEGWSLYRPFYLHSSDILSHLLPLVLATIALYFVFALKKGQNLRTALLIAYFPVVIAFLELKVHMGTRLESFSFDLPYLFAGVGVTCSIVAVYLVWKSRVASKIKKTLLYFLMLIPAIFSFGIVLLLGIALSGGI